MKRVANQVSRAFTLMEMLLVLAIIALLVGMGTYMMINVLGDAEEGKAKADVSSLEASLVRYKTKTLVYPTTEQGLEALVRMPTVGPKPQSYKPLLRKAALTDPWGNPYQYARPGKFNPDSYDIFSMGLDGKAGTSDDIGNW